MWLMVLVWMTVVMGMVIVYAALILVLNLLADLLAAAVDPRISLS